MAFKILEKDRKTKARIGVLKTKHVSLETPFFMPVATKGSVKHITNEELGIIGYKCFITNALILSMKPSLEVIESFGGIHNFVNWKYGIFTDSGGFQILKEDLHIKTNEEGILFRNPFDNSKFFLTPKKAIEIQNRIKSDVAMCLDDVVKMGLNKEIYSISVARTQRWAEICKKNHKNRDQLLFGICQGGIYKDLRKESIRGLLDLDFNGISIGGLSIGEKKEEMYDIIRFCKQIIPEDRPVYLMGVGSARELLEAICLGVDIFDSNFPTRTARHGLAITSEGNISIENSKFKKDNSQLDKNCDCYVCKFHSKAYIHHLYKTKEENGAKYLTYHNLHFVYNLINKAKKKIKEGKLIEFKRKFNKIFNN
ncbi:MAG: tRNA guanosine(34) transglycosylase Tgt [Candidatus Diapherotrites archaeon]|nr:tRNA guanosine(34) transglycosylase Tgt [Candidatus Diapherotrites archaeon]